MNSTEMKKQLMLFKEQAEKGCLSDMREAEECICMTTESILLNCLNMKEELEKLMEYAFFSFFSIITVKEVEKFDSYISCSMESIWFSKQGLCCTYDFEDKDCFKSAERAYIISALEETIDMIDYSESKYGVFTINDWN